MAVVGVTYLADSFDHVRDAAERTHMVTPVLALTTAPTRPGRPPHATHQA